MRKFHPLLALAAILTLALPAVAQDTFEGPPEPETTSGKRFLVVGDSHTQGAFGWALDYMLRTGVEESVVATYAVCASNPVSWVKSYKHHCGSLERGEDYKPDSKRPGLVARGLKAGTHRPPRIVDLLKKHTPDTLVVALGENLKGFSSERVSTFSTAFIKRLECYKRGVETEAECKDLDLSTKEPIRDLTCVWVLPHYSRSKGSTSQLGRLYKTIEDISKGTCEVIDSRPMTCKQGWKDDAFVCDSGNYHLTPQRYRRWAVAVMDKLTAMLDLKLTDEAYTAGIVETWGLK